MRITIRRKRSRDFDSLEPGVCWNDVHIRDASGEDNLLHVPSPLVAPARHCLVRRDRTRVLLSNWLARRNRSEEPVFMKHAKSGAEMKRRGCFRSPAFKAADGNHLHETSLWGNGKGRHECPIVSFFYDFSKKI